MFEAIVIAACLLGLYLFRPREPLRCGKCYTKLEHHCGMGACVDMCPKCDVLR